MPDVTEPQPGAGNPAPPSSSPAAPSWADVLREIERARAGWSEALEAYDNTARTGHERLRRDVQGLNSTVESNYRHFDDMDKLTRARLGTLEAVADRPVDATKLVLSTRAIVAVVMAAVTIAASYWNLSTKIDGQEKIRDMQISAMQKSIEQTSKSYELLRLDLQALQQTVIAGKAKQ